MMVELLPSAEGPAHGAIESVLENLRADNTPLPARVFVDDGDRSWLGHAAVLPVEARRRSVLAAASEASLVDALLFEIGGALRRPVSTPSMEAACESAAGGGTVVPMATQGVLDAMIDHGSRLMVVGWRQRAFWQRQVGSIRPIAWLVEIADRLARVPVILPGPVLVVSGRTPAEIEAVCSDDWGGSASVPFLTPPRIDELPVKSFSKGRQFRIEDVLAVSTSGSVRLDDRPNPSFPVLEIPSGRRVGHWSLAPTAGTDEAGWGAFPMGHDEDGGCWELVREDGSSEVVRESTSLARDTVAGQTLIRVPGFAGAELRRGSPAGLLIEELAGHPGRAGRPIWVPSVDAEGVRFLLSLPGPIWVDGPGVPS
jgi:hypothetical protein